MTARNVRIPMEGKRYGRWFVIKHDPSKKITHYFCKCDCGTKRIVRAISLQNGHSKSCGCFHDFSNRKGWIKHGYSRQGKVTKTFSCWNDMKQRCLNPRKINYQGYGGRGITVCERWLKFENFLKDMGDAPLKMSLDRIDNAKGYFKENCRWASREQQMNNTRLNRWITFKNETKTITQWSKEIGITASAITGRLKYGWPIEQVLSSKKFNKWNRIAIKNSPAEITKNIAGDK